MSILSRYVLREYAKYFSLTLAAFLPVAFTFHALEKTRKLSEHPAALRWFLKMMLYQMPALVSDLFPFIMLFSTLVTLRVFRHQNALTAFGSLGVSPLRLNGPILAFGLLTSLFFSFLNDAIIPRWLQAAREIQDVQVERKRSAIHLAENRIWFLENARTIWNIHLVEPDKKRMRGVRIFRLRADFSLQEEIEARTLTRSARTDTVGILSHGVWRTFGADGDVRIRPFRKKLLLHLPKDFTRLAARPREMTRQQLASYTRHLTEAGLSARRYAVDLHAKGAFPFANFMMVLLAIALAAGGPIEGRSSGMVLGLSLGIAYWFVFSTLLSLGHAGTLAPWFAAWGANLLYLSMGVALLIKTRR